MLDIIIIVVIS